MAKYQLIAMILHPEMPNANYGWNKEEFPTTWEHYANLCKSMIRKDALKAARILMTEFKVDSDNVETHPEWDQELAIDMTAEGIYLFEKI